MIEWFMSTHLICPYCSSGRVVKNGTREGRQRYKCQLCHGQFAGNGGGRGGHHFPVEQIAAAIEMYYSGKSYGKTVLGTLDTVGKKHSTQTVHSWVRTYTGVAVTEMGKLKASTLGAWLVRHMPVPGIGQSPFAYIWAVFDFGTNYMLAGLFRTDLDVEAARDVICRALAVSNRQPDSIVHYTFWPSDPALFPRKAAEVIAEEFPNASPTQAMLRPVGPFGGDFEGTFPPWPNARRFFRTAESAQRHLDGGMVVYNFFERQRELGGMTPGQWANVDYPFAGWVDVVQRGPER